MFNKIKSHISNTIAIKKSALKHSYSLVWTSACNTNIKNILAYIHTSKLKNNNIQLLIVATEPISAEHVKSATKLGANIILTNINTPCPYKAATLKATKQWLMFLEPQERIHYNSIIKLDRFLSTKNKENIIYCALNVFFSRVKRKLNTHQLRSRFQKQNRTHSLTTATALNDTKPFELKGALFQTQHMKLVLNKLNTNNSIFSAYMINREYFSNAKGSVAIFKDAHFISEIEAVDFTEKPICHLNSIAIYLKNKQLKPWEAQALIHTIYNLFFHKKIGKVVGLDLLNDEEKSISDKLISTIFNSLTIEMISSYSTPGIDEAFKPSVLARYKNFIAPTIAKIDAANTSNKLLQINYFFYNKEPKEQLLVNGKDCLPIDVKITTCNFLGKPLFFKKTLIISFDKKDGVFDFYVSESIFIGNRCLPTGLKLSTLCSEAKPAVINKPKGEWLKKIANLSIITNRYKDAWLFMDRSDLADDNAQHMYNYVSKNHPEINAYFILERKSPHYAALKNAGVKLLAFGSFQHKLALVLAKNIISSHAGAFAFEYLPKSTYGNIFNYKKIFLQHGIILGDLSQHFQGKNLDLFVTSTHAEYDSIADSYSTYEMPKSVVKLTGLPRHDALVEKSIQYKGKEKTILIFPTWRKYLVSPALNRSATRIADDSFYESDYWERWSALMKNTTFIAALNERGITVNFVNHPAMQPYMDYISDNIDLVNVLKPSIDFDSIQDVMAESILMITDYSSIAFDMAVTGKPVFYYQFDHEEFLDSGAHTTVRGYFDFERDGFGPVTYNEDDLIASILNYIDTKTLPIHVENNLQNTFAFMDTSACERVMNAVLDLDHSGKITIPEEVKTNAINNAINAKDFNLAQQRLGNEPIQNILTSDTDIIAYAKWLRSSINTDAALKYIERILPAHNHSIEIKLYLIELIGFDTNRDKCTALTNELNNIINNNKIGLSPSQALRFSFLQLKKREYKHVENYLSQYNGIYHHPRRMALALKYYSIRKNFDDCISLLKQLIKQQENKINISDLYYIKMLCKKASTHNDFLIIIKTLCNATVHTEVRKTLIKEACSRPMQIALYTIELFGLTKNDYEAIPSDLHIDIFYTLIRLKNYKSANLLLSIFDKNNFLMKKLTCELLVAQSQWKELNDFSRAEDFFEGEYFGLAIYRYVSLIMTNIRPGLIYLEINHREYEHCISRWNDLGYTTLCKKLRLEQANNMLAAS
jgi:CDP-ribitol ribitolphosphotransferase / teichoic acid ribitol-phosphate polymerase